MVSSRVQVTHSGLPTFINTDQWTYLLKAFSSHLPLHNLHWKSPTHPSIRTVQELQVDLVPLEVVKEEERSQVPGSLLEKPLLNLYFVICEDNDTYKNTVRKQVRDWISVVSQRRNQEWVIVLVVRPETRPAGSARLFNIKSTMLDRLKSDFNAKRDRCVQLNWSLAVDEPAGWADFILKVKESIISSFDTSVVARMEEVKRSEGQRHMPGWNFCTFFVLKESLALSFEGMNLLEDALTVYDELELSFYQVLKEMNLSWFGKLGGTDPSDDSSPLLSLTKKPYRNLMLANTITVFDFRCYLLARQCSLLGQMLKVTRLAKKAAQFISGFVLTLEDESRDTFPDFYLESWVYSSALSVVDQCEMWASTVTLDSGATVALNGAMGELLELARNQLDKIGMHTGHLPSVEPFNLAMRDARDSHSIASISTTDRGPPAQISNEDLIAAVESRDAFDKLYISVTKRAIEAFVVGKRKRFALRLHFSLAVLDTIRGHLSAAQSVYHSLPAHYTHSHWAPIEAPLLTRSIDSQKSAESKGAEWIAEALSLLKSHVRIQRLDEEGTLQAEFAALGGVETYFANLWAEIREVGGSLSEDLDVKDHPCFSLVVSGRKARPAEGQDGSFLDVVVHSHLPFEARVDRIEVELVSLEGERVVFTVGAVTLPSGKSKQCLFCPLPASGLYLFEKWTIALSHIRFNHVLPANPSDPTTAHTVLLPSDYACTDVFAGPPRTMYLDQTPRLMLALVTGRNYLRRATFTIKDGSGNVMLQVEKAEREGRAGEKGEGSLKCENDEIMFENIPAFSTVDVTIPYYGTDRGSGISLVIEGTYVTEREPDVVRVLRRTRVVRVTLPMAVNVQDFFRSSSVFSKFTVSSDGQQHLRLLDAKLSGQTALYQVETCRKSAMRSTLVSPTRNASFLFRLRSTGTPLDDDAGEGLRILITYTNLWDEIIYLVRQQAVRAATAANLQEHSEWLHRTLLTSVRDDAEQPERYALTGVILATTPALSESAIASYERGHNAQAALMESLTQAAEALTTPAECPPTESEAFNIRTLSIPVDVPVTKILNKVRIDLSKSSDRSAIFAGQPVSVSLSISTVVNGEGDHMADAAEHRLAYDVVADFGTWLVSGQKRGEFSASKSAQLTVPLTLIPVRHGSLFLPQVTVYPIGGEGPATNGRISELPSSDTYQENAAERILVLTKASRTTYSVSLPTPNSDVYHEYDVGG